MFEIVPYTLELYNIGYMDVSAYLVQILKNFFENYINRRIQRLIFTIMN